MTWPFAHLPHWPRGLSDDLAAAYVGLGLTKFRELVKDGAARIEANQGTRPPRAMPQPVRLTPGRLVWLREDLDAWLDEMRGTPTHSAPATGAASWMAALRDD